TGVAVFGVDALVGSVFVGTTLAVLAAWGTYSLVRGSGDDRPFADLVRRASDRYVGTSVTAWEFARGKLRMDPIYRATLSLEVLQLLAPEDQDMLLADMAARLDHDGVLIVREADASAGWRFAAVRLGNRLKLLASGAWRQPFHPRSEADWRACFASHGFRTD